MSPGRASIEVGDRTIGYGRLLIATGSVPSIPPIPGLDGVEFWTNREATSTHEVPERLIVVGAGAGRVRAGPGVRAHGLAGDDRRRGRAAAGPRPSRCRGAARRRAHGRGRDPAAGPDARSGRARPARVACGRHEHRGRPAADRHRPARERRGARLRGARSDHLEARRRGRRAAARRRARLGGGRCHRDRDVHPCRQVPGPARGGRDGRATRCGPTTGPCRRSRSPTRRWRPSARRRATAR